MKSFLVPLLAGVAVGLGLIVFPAQAPATERGCDYRLQSLADAEVALDFALRTGKGVEEARAEVLRARKKATEEGCFQAQPAPPPRTEYRDRDYREDNRNEYRENREERRARQRFDDLIRLGYSRGLTRDEFREFEDLRKRLDR